MLGLWINVLLPWHRNLVTLCCLCVWLAYDYYAFHKLPIIEKAYISEPTKYIIAYKTHNCYDNDCYYTSIIYLYGVLWFSHWTAADKIQKKSTGFTLKISLSVIMILLFWHVIKKKQLKFLGGVTVLDLLFFYTNSIN